MTREDQASVLRTVYQNEAFTSLFDQLERDAFEEFMRIPAWRRYLPRGKGRTLIAHIEALRNVRSRLNSIAMSSTQRAVPRQVV